MRRPGAILFALLVLGAGAALALTPLISHAGTPRWSDATADGGTLAVRGGLAFIELAGPPAVRGRQHGHLVGRQATDLLAIMEMNPRAALASSRIAGCVAAIAPEDRAEITALAEASAIPVGVLLVANATVESMCSAAVHVPAGGSPVVARNMDFFPSAALGPSTIIQVVRPPAGHAYAAVTWPGMIGVISGMNDAGLTACILLNHRGDCLPPAEPLPLRVRRALMTCTTVAEAMQVFAASPVGSPHYLLLADRRTATVAWWAVDGLHRDDPAGGWLVASNGARVAGEPDDDRGACLHQAITALGGSAPDPVWFRRVVSASYLIGLNAQAMVFAPADRRLELALAHGQVPAAHGTWWVVELGALLDGAHVTAASVDVLPAERPMRHYRLGGGD